MAVIYEGKIVAIVDAKETNEQQLGLLMAGGTGKEEGEHKWLKFLTERTINILVPVLSVVFGFTCWCHCNVS